MNKNIEDLVFSIKGYQDALVLAKKGIDLRLIKLSKAICNVVDDVWKKYFGNHKEFGYTSDFMPYNECVLSCLIMASHSEEWINPNKEIYINIFHLYGKDKIERDIYFKDNKWYYDKAIECTYEDKIKEYGDMDVYWDAWENDPKTKNNYVGFEDGPSVEDFQKFLDEVNEELGDNLLLVPGKFYEG